MGKSKLERNRFVELLEERGKKIGNAGGLISRFEVLVGKDKMMVRAKCSEVKQLKLEDLERLVLDLSETIFELVSRLLLEI